MPATNQLSSVIHCDHTLFILVRVPGLVGSLVLCLEIVHDGSMVCKSLYVLSIVLFSFALQLDVFHLIKYLGGENRIEPCFLCDLLYIIHECRKLPIFLCRILCVCFCVQEMKNSV